MGSCKSKQQVVQTSKFDNYFNTNQSIPPPEYCENHFIEEQNQENLTSSKSVQTLACVEDNKDTYDIINALIEEGEKAIKNKEFSLAYGIAMCGLEVLDNIPSEKLNSGPEYIKHPKVWGFFKASAITWIYKNTIRE